jgi:hypothetical protein
MKRLSSPKRCPAGNRHRDQGDAKLNQPLTPLHEVKLLLKTHHVESPTAQRRRSRSLK